MAVSTDYSSNSLLNSYGTLKQDTTKDTTKTDTSTKEEKDTSVALTGLGDNFNNFLRLLTTQMQNQDPLKPMDTNDMTKQLVDFANVEQNIGTNSRLDKLLKLQQSGTASTNLAYLGRTIAYEGDTFDYAEGMTTAPLGYELETQSKSTRVDILDSENRIVRSFEGETKAGTKHVVNWDFKDDKGVTVQPGTYRLNIAPKGETDEDIIKATTYTFGVVNGVGYGKDGETTVTVGSNEIPLSDVMTVH